MRIQANKLRIEATILAGVLGLACLPSLFASERPRAQPSAGSVAPPANPGSDAQIPAKHPAPVLLELFTSEGCSSCPPADALLKQLDGTTNSAGQMLIGLSEHVTYWNDLGWRDPYSADLFTARQNAYSDRFHLGSVYTPQLVINGNAQVVGSDRRGLARALETERQAGQSEPAMLHIESVRRVREGLAVSYTLLGTAQSGPAELYAALADDVDRSNVLRGENGGRTLTHAAVVRSLVPLGAAQPAGRSQQITVHLPASAITGAHQHLVLFLQQENFGPVLSVTEQPLGSQ